ncbi:hypothetical protein RFI_26355 [Reticulomyxa filosa]|uniref:Uncharacterized protein n=1 Tax=Reticulomyxa filosa TaxID=46433 RepID=X6MAJ2_RETFI|nr:hypothetical protein RFI_26355 [Reticulomyxa filosa]|eukprot:ETO11023.1 hypothetical protein RFI_26355 [Reticulomyxa filosa]
MAAETSLPTSLSLTGEEYVQQDKPKELLAWIKMQNNPKTCLQKLFLYSLRYGKWNCATELLKSDESLLQTHDGMKQNILFYWADGMQRNKNVKEATKWLSEHVCLEAIKRMINEANEEGSTIFHAVALTGQCELLQWILDKCPELDINKGNNYGYTALHKASRNGQKNSIVWLLEHQADISAITVNGDRAEHEVLKHGSIELIPYLQPPIYWPDNLNSDTKISFQAKYDRAQTIRLSFPNKRLSENEAIEYHSKKLSLCCVEYETLVIQSMHSVPQLAIACLLALSDAMLSHSSWMNNIDVRRAIYRQSMGYAAAACTMAVKHFNLVNALSWQKQSSSQQIRVLAQVLPSSEAIPSELCKTWSKLLTKLRQNA